VFSHPAKACAAALSQQQVHRRMGPFGVSAVGRFSFGVTLWLFNIAMENGPFIDGLPFTY
jgi:hypothetical protein